jgi:hypothetical protein
MTRALARPINRVLPPHTRACRIDMASKHVFVSYAREDRDFAHELKRLLQGSRVSAWQDTLNIRVGYNWQDEIDNALRSASVVIVIMSPHATRSQFVTYEWAFAIGAGVRVIPVLLRPTTLHPKLATIQFVDFTKRKAWVRLRQALPFVWRKRRVAPGIRARFEIKDQNPEPAAKGYVVSVSVLPVPGNTKKVTYEIYDETLKLLKLSSTNAKTNFEATFTTDGDVLVRATIKTPTREISVDAPLFEALRRTHGSSKKKAVRGALLHIKEN